MSRYFPRRVTVARPLEGVTVQLRLGGTKLNKELPESVFLPVERPGWQIIDLDLEPLATVQGFDRD